jgi:hypothetical protein
LFILSAKDSKLVTINMSRLSCKCVRAAISVNVVLYPFCKQIIMSQVVSTGYRQASINDDRRRSLLPKGRCNKSKQAAHMSRELLSNLVLIGGSVEILEHGATASIGAHSLDLLGFRITEFGEVRTAGISLSVSIARGLGLNNRLTIAAAPDRSNLSGIHMGMRSTPAKSCKPMSNVGLTMYM